MIRILFLLFLLMVSGASAFAQQSSSNPFMNDANGRPLYMRVNYVADGTPYLYEDYTLTEITMANGNVYPNIKAKFNLTENQVLYLNEKGEELIATAPVSKIIFYSFISNETSHETITLQGLNAALNTPAAHVYQILEEGKARLLKELIVTISDAKKYGEATITRTFKRKEVYMALLPAAPAPVKFDRNKEAVAALFGPDQPQVSAFIEQHKLKCKTEKDLVEVFRFYNTL